MDITKSGVNESRHSIKDLETYSLMEEAFNKSQMQLFDKLEAFPRFTSKRSLARFIVKYEIFKNILSINGVIIECGVYNGSGLFSWAQLSNIFEPVNYNRKIIGFDTFEGFVEIGESDINVDKKPCVGDLRGAELGEFELSVKKYSNERHLMHIKNIELVKGDFIITGQKYIEQNPHLIVSLLYLDFDLYEPTKKALELFLPRMCKGAIVCFDQLNCINFPGETKALIEEFDLKKYELKRFPIDPWISYITL